MIGVSFWHTPRSPHSKSNREISKYGKDLIELFCSVIDADGPGEAYMSTDSSSGRVRDGVGWGGGGANIRICLIYGSIF